MGVASSRSLCAAGARRGYAADRSSLTDMQLSDSYASGATLKVAIPRQILDSFTPVGPSREYPSLLTFRWILAPAQRIEGVRRVSTKCRQRRP